MRVIYIQALNSQRVVFSGGSCDFIREHVVCPDCQYRAIRGNIADASRAAMSGVVIEAVSNSTGTQRRGTSEVQLVLAKCVQALPVFIRHQPYCDDPGQHNQPKSGNDTLHVRLVQL
jgi:hypothetical protein